VLCDLSGCLFSRIASGAKTVDAFRERGVIFVKKTLVRKTTDILI